MGGREQYGHRAVSRYAQHSDTGIRKELSEKIICFLEELFQMNLKIRMEILLNREGRKDILERVDGSFMVR